MERVPSNHRQAERILIALVRRGEWEIDANGQIWRTSIRQGNRWTGESRLISCPRRRVEKRLSHGYLMVRATIDNRRVCGLAHRLVWQHTNGDIPDGAVINHRNGLRDDNRPTNLETGSYSDNQKHAHRAGLLDEHGQRNPAAKLKDNHVAQIRNAYANGGYTQQQLADRFGVRHQHVSKIVKGERRPKQGGPVARKDLRHSTVKKDPTTGRFIKERLQANA